MSIESIFHTLREANVARSDEWTKGQGIDDFTWRGSELGGEIGEVCEIIARRDAYDRRDELAEELADGVITIDLAGWTMGFEPIPPNYAAGSIPVGGLMMEAGHLAINTLKLLNDIKKLERERRNWAGSRVEPAEVETRLRYIAGRLGTIAGYCKIDLLTATEAKFNATSVKVGLATRLYLRSTEHGLN
jgi:NTP pyrophosphatase (non-canonical NTP hydrolase)